MKRLYILLIMVYASFIVISPVLGTKVISLFGLKFTAGLFTILAAFTLLDVVNELWGPKDARFLAVTIILIRVVLFAVVAPLVVLLPSYLEPRGYADVLQTSLRTFLASEVNTLVQNVLINIPVFHRLKRIKFGFYFRANVANLVSWTFGSVFFVLISYAGAGKPLLPVMIGQTLVKFPFSFVYSWLGLLIVKKARRLKGREQSVSGLV
jgi:uncharacterized integral membrane protein (TIGR00697 family)